MKDCMEEYFDIVDEHDRVIGTALRSECHGNPSLLHRTVHVIVFHSDGRILLQKRSATKDIQPSKWDSAVGGHLCPGEDYLIAARREMSEELGIDRDLPLRFLFDSKIRNEIESENIKVFSTIYDGPFHFDKTEIDEIRFWSREELDASIGEGIFTPNLEEELYFIRVKIYERNVVATPQGFEP